MMMTIMAIGDIGEGVEGVIRGSRPQIESYR